MSKKILFSLVAFFIVSLAGFALINSAKAVGTTFVVNSVNDSVDSTIGDGNCEDATGLCTLRAAIQEANFDSGKDTINFNLSGSTDYSIKVTSQLPAIIYPIIIDGTSDPSYVSQPVIELSGELLPATSSASGLMLTAGNSIIKGLAINRFTAYGISIYINGNNNIENNIIGLDKTGTQIFDGWRGKNSIGIHIFNSSNNIIGGDNAGQGNIISGNRSGILIKSLITPANTAANKIINNYIGTNSALASGLGNDDWGIKLTKTSNTDILNNVIAANGGTGIILDNALNTTILRNTIGSPVFYETELGNTGNGIEFNETANSIAVGDNNDSNANLIANNQGLQIKAPANYANTTPIGINNIYDYKLNPTNINSNCNSDTNVNLSWTYPNYNKLKSYFIFRSENPNNIGTLLYSTDIMPSPATGQTGSYTDKNSQSGVTYYYTIRIKGNESNYYDDIFSSAINQTLLTCHTQNYPGFIFHLDKKSYYTNDVMRLKLERLDNSTEPYGVNIFGKVNIVGQDGKKFLLKPEVVVDKFTTTVINLDEYDQFKNYDDQPREYSLIICSQIEGCPAGVANATLINIKQVPNNNIFYLKLNNNFTDQSGIEPTHINNQTGISFTPGIEGQAVKFTNSSYAQYSCENVVDYNAGTVEAWIKFDSFSKSDQAIWHTNDSRFVLYYDYSPSNPHARIRLKARAGGIERYYIIKPNDGNLKWVSNDWHHIALTWENGPATTGTMNFYIDGKFVDSFNYSSFSSNCSSFRIGNSYSNSMPWNQGLIDEVKIHKARLSAPEILQSYNTYKTSNPPNAQITSLVPTSLKPGDQLHINGTDLGYDCNKTSSPVCEMKVGFGNDYFNWTGLKNLPTDWWTDTQIILIVPENVSSNYIYLKRNESKTDSPYTNYTIKGPYLTITSSTKATTTPEPIPEPYCNPAKLNPGCKCVGNAIACLTPKKITPVEVKEIKNKAKLLKENKLDQVLQEINELRDIIREQKNEIKYLKELLLKVKAISEQAQADINYFITYGVDDNTKALGEGERAAAVNSYARAFGQLPEDEEGLTDLIKIANGRFPGKFSPAAEEKAYDQFKKIYNREPDVFKNPNDNAAIKVMTYGLRQAAHNRNLNSEKQGVETFKHFYGKLPETSEEWDIMQAITYSGATRTVIDADNDGLSDKMEAILGTDKNNPDTDEDGYLDGQEIVNNYSPL